MNGFSFDWAINKLTRFVDVAGLGYASNYPTRESTQRHHQQAEDDHFFASHFQLRLIYRLEPVNSNQPPKGNSLPGDGKNDGSTAPKMILVNQKLTMIITGTANAARDSETREILVMPV